MRRKKQNFIQGAVVLMAASLIVKVIGAFFQVPLQNLIGGKESPAFGLFSKAYRIYTAMLVISTVGLPAALSKMVAEATACGREREVRRIVRVAGGIFVPVGTVCTFVLVFGAGTFASWIKSADAGLAVMAIAPSVLMVSILSVLRGYYQGRGNMVPTAISQVIEALGKLFIGLALASYAVDNGFTDAAVAAMTVLGVTLGEVAAVIYMLIQAMLSRRSATTVKMLNDVTRPSSKLAKLLLSLSIPITISSAVMSLTDLIDVALISLRLQSPAVGMSAEQADIIYGIYTGQAINFFNLPQTLITALAVSVLPTIASAKAAQNFTKISQTLETTLRLTMIITLPAGAGFLVISEPILRLLYSSGVELGGTLMGLLGFAVPAVALVAITNAALQAFGRIDLPLISMFLGALVKIFGDYYLIGNPVIGILGAPVSTALCYWLIAAVNLFHIGRLSRSLPKPGKTVWRPFAATVGMGAAAYSCFTLITRATSALPGSRMDKLATLITIAFAAGIYIVLLLMLRAVDREDVLLLPGGEKIADILHLK